ncbi:hypothetical protein ABW19_dt0210532 [Dactylella cylindrospora]|nr:hypothetical protein ABW19_dt0210532 [Dactylella cylindrospora]
MEETLDDLSVKFIINLPQEELVSKERVGFQIEEAHWYYEDFVKDQNKDAFNSLKLSHFLGEMFKRNPMLSKWGLSQEAYKEFNAYKQSVPVRGGILLNEKMDKVILVKGFKTATWAFPRGKINKDELDHVCAAREILEETGFDSSSLIDPEQYLIDVEDLGDNAQRHLKLFLIRNVPEDFDFHPLVRKEISLSKSKEREHDTDPNPEPKFKAYKVFNFLPGILKWIKNQRRISRQQARNQRRQAGIYETEPESSAVEFSPPRKPKSQNHDDQTTDQDSSGGVMSSAAQTASQPSDVIPTSGLQMDENSLSIASAKLRDLVGVGTAPQTARPPESTFDKVNAGQSILAQLKGPGLASPIETAAKHPFGVSIPVSRLFDAAKQPQSGPQTPTNPMPAQIFPPATIQTHNAANQAFAPGRYPQPHNHHVGHPRQQKNPNAQYHSPKQQQQQITILQRGQPLPDGSFQAQSPFSSPDTPRQSTQTLEMTPTQQQQSPQETSNSPAKITRRPMLTIDSFTPPAPAQPPSLEHKGTLLDILRGSKPPPPAEPPINLQGASDMLPANKPTTILPYSEIEPAGPPQAIVSARDENNPKPLTPVNGAQQKDVDHLAALMKSLGRPTPKRITPPETINKAAVSTPVRNALVENEPTQAATKATTTLESPINTTQNGFLTPPNTVSIPTGAKPPSGFDTTNKIPSFDRRATVKPEQAQTLLGLFKAPTAENAATAPLPNASQPSITSKPVPSVGRMVAPPMDRKSSLSAEQRASLMGILNDVATQHGV